MAKRVLLVGRLTPNDAVTAPDARRELVVLVDSGGEKIYSKCRIPDGAPSAPFLSAAFTALDRLVREQEAGIR